MVRCFFFFEGGGYNEDGKGGGWIWVKKCFYGWMGSRAAVVKLKEMQARTKQNKKKIGMKGEKKEEEKSKNVEKLLLKENNSTKLNHCNRKKQQTATCC